MKKVIKTGIKKAGFAEPAIQNELHCEAYRKSAQLSMLKLHIGEVLLFGDKQQRPFWPLLDVMLRQYFTLKQIEGKQ